MDKNKFLNSGHRPAPFPQMTLINAKPQLRKSLSIVGTAVILGLAAASLVPNRGSALSTANSDGASLLLA